MANTSYAQAGEDLAIKFACDYLKVPAITYLDIGAYEPVTLSNTYFFYARGHRGVLIEPNPALCAKLRRERPGDTVFEGAIAPGARGLVAYYEMSEPGWSTVSKAEAARMMDATGGSIRLAQIGETPALDINRILESEFKGTAPTFVSLDAEGTDLEILQSLNFARFRPQIFCVETLTAGTTYTNWNITQFMVSRNYSVRGGSLVNTLYVDNALL